MNRARFVLLGGCLLAFLAASLNTAFMVRLGTSVSHLTGDVSRFAIDLSSAGSEPRTAVSFLAAALTGFVAGAMLSGALIHHPRLELSRPYGRSIAGIGVLLLGANQLLPRSEVGAVALAATACGYQNALATHFRGVILRTTHVTGLLTDLGVMLGMRLRGHSVDSFKIGAPACLVLAFFLGALAGAFASTHFGTDVFLVIGLAYLAGGLGWTVLKRTMF